MGKRCPILFLFVVVTVCRQACAGFDCIEKCKCQADEGHLLANCTGIGYQRIPEAHTTWVTQVQTLILDYNKITKIHKSAFSKFFQLGQLSLRGNELEYIEEGSFQPLQTKNLTHLDLSHNFLRSDFLEELRHVQVTLEYLSLSYNVLRHLPHVIGEMTNLRHLDLSHNKLIVIPQNFLPASLTQLDLSHNTIKRFHNSTFAKCTRLRRLTLSDSYASSDIRFEPAVFRPLVAVEYLDLSRCFCRRISPDSFASMRGLKTLKLRKSYLTKLPRFSDTNGFSFSSEAQLPASRNVSWRNPLLEELDISQNTRLAFTSILPPFPPSLRTLDLSYDPIRAINERLLSNLVQLRQLRLDGNRVAVIADRALSNHRHLRSLSASLNSLLRLPHLPPVVAELSLPGNRIKRLDAAMKSLDGAERVDVSRGRIEEVEEGVMWNLTRLTHLNVSSNLLTNISHRTFEIRSPSSLQVLDLQKNEISAFHGSPFASHGSLRELYVHENRIGSVDAHALQGLSSLEILDLSVNDIEDVSPDALSNLVQLKVLRLDNNKLRVVWPHQFDKLSYLHTLTLHDNELIEIKPQTLPVLTQLSLVDNQLFTVPHLVAPNLQKLILSRNNLTEIDRNSFVGSRRLEYIDLCVNTDLVLDDYRPFELLHNLTYLNVAECLISRFVDVRLASLETLVMYRSQLVSEELADRSLADLLPSLRDIDLSFNNITHISAPFFAGSSCLRSIDLKGNDFECDCALRPLVEWIYEQELAVDVVDFDSYMCATPAEFFSYPVAHAIDMLNCTQPTTPSTTTTIAPPGGNVVKEFEIVIMVLLVLLIVIAVAIFIQRRRTIAAAAHPDTPSQASSNQSACGGPTWCCLPLFKLGDGGRSAGATQLRSQRLTVNQAEENDDELGLMVPASSSHDPGNTSHDPDTSSPQRL